MHLGSRKQGDSFRSSTRRNRERKILGEGEGFRGISAVDNLPVSCPPFPVLGGSIDMKSGVYVIRIAGLESMIPERFFFIFWIRCAFVFCRVDVNSLIADISQSFLNQKEGS